MPTKEYLRTQTKAAKAFCLKYKREHPTEKNLAIVSDIDETLFDNREQFEKMTKPNWEQFNAWVNEARAPLLQDTFLFLKWAREKGFAIFLITGRPESDRFATISNLVRNGVSYDGLIYEIIMVDHRQKSSKQVCERKLKTWIQDCH